MLLSFEEIRQGLDEKFVPLEPMLTGLRLLPNADCRTPLGRWSDESSAALPGGLREMAERFDLGRLTIGPVTFGNRGDYAHDLDLYNPQQAADVELGFLVFAISDPFSVAISRKDGSIYVIDPEKIEPEGPIASSVAQFLRGLGTVFLKRTEVLDKISLADEVAGAVDSSSEWFWRWLSN